MIQVDKKTNHVTIPQGDTGRLRVQIMRGDGEPLTQQIVGVAIWAVCQKVGTKGEYNTIVKQICPIVVGNVAVVDITNRISRVIPPGDYQWDIRVVFDPDYDEEGNVIAGDDTDEVHSCFAGQPGGMPKYTVPGVAVDV